MRLRQQGSGGWASASRRAVVTQTLHAYTPATQLDQARQIFSSRPTPVGHRFDAQDREAIEGKAIALPFQLGCPAWWHEAAVNGLLREDTRLEQPQPTRQNSPAGGRSTALRFFLPDGRCQNGRRRTLEGDLWQLHPPCSSPPPLGLERLKRETAHRSLSHTVTDSNRSFALAHESEVKLSGGSRP